MAYIIAQNWSMSFFRDTQFRKKQMPICQSTHIYWFSRHSGGGRLHTLLHHLFSIKIPVFIHWFWYCKFHWHWYYSSHHALSSVQSSPSVMSDSLRLHGLQHARPPSPSLTPGVHPNPCPSSWWCHPPSCPGSSSSPAPNPSQHQGFFQWVNSSYEVAKVLEHQLQYQSFQWTPRTHLL